MTKAVKKNELKKSLSEAGYYLSEGFRMALMLVYIVVTSVIAVLGAAYVMIAPMQYWSPWWGLVSIPVVIVLACSAILWWSDR